MKHQGSGSEATWSKQGKKTNLEDSGGLVSKLREARCKRGGSSPALQVQHTKVLKKHEEFFERLDALASFTSSSSSWQRMVSSSTQDLSNWFSSTSAHLKQAAATAIAPPPRFSGVASSHYCHLPAVTWQREQSWWSLWVSAIGIS